ncbi:MAG: hypothetical protein K2N76_02260, partial [Muribaculaceae bacterium]|nr:hypothetical protein [Muribaculaceae bacterium]
MQNLNRLQQRIADTNAGIKRLQLRIDSIVGASKAVSDSIALRESELATLRGHYARTVRASRRYRREMNTINFLFSADDFSQAYRRMRYLEEYSGWRHRKTEQIQQVMADLGKQKERLAEMHSRLNALKASASREYRSLRQSRDSAQTVINSLKGEPKRLNTLLRRQQNQLKSLDDELTRLIAREEAERKAAEEAARRKAEAERAAAEKARAEAAKKQAGKNQRGDNRQEAKPEKTTPKPA